MRIGVPRETRPGETRVAATPKTVEQIVALGYAVFVEQGAGAASSFDDAAYVRAGADVIDEAVWNADVLLKINAPSEAEIALLRPGQVVVVAAGAGAEPRPGGGAGGSWGDRAGDGCRAADLAGPVAGRAVVDGEHRWVPGGGRGGARVRVVLHRAGDRGGEGPAGEGAGGGCRGRRPGGDRHGILAGCGGARVRRPSRGRRAGGVDGCGVPAHRRRGGRAVGRRVRAGDQRRLRRQGRGAVCRAGGRRRHPDHHGADPGTPRAAADHRGDGGLDEAGFGGGRHGRLERRQRGRHGGRPEGGHPQRGDDPGLHRPAGPPPHAGLAALRHQPGQPAQAGHRGQGRRVRPGPRGPGAARDDGGARGRGALAAAAGAGVRGPGRRSGPGRWRRSRRRCR